MTAGLNSRPIAGPIVSLSRGALAILLAATLLAGGLLGATVAFEVGSTTSTGSLSEIPATSSSLVAQALIDVRAGERASEAEATAGHVTNRIAPSERDSLRLEHVPNRIGPAITGQLNEKRR